MARRRWVKGGGNFQCLVATSTALVEANGILSVARVRFGSLFLLKPINWLQVTLRICNNNKRKKNVYDDSVRVPPSCKLTGAPEARRAGQWFTSQYDLIRGIIIILDHAMNLFRVTFWKDLLRRSAWIEIEWFGCGLAFNDASRFTNQTITNQSLTVVHMMFGWLRLFILLS